jgi:hypothetical protein
MGDAERQSVATIYPAKSVRVERHKPFQFYPHDREST